MVGRWPRSRLRRPKPSAERPELAKTSFISDTCSSSGGSAKMLPKCDEVLVGATARCHQGRSSCVGQLANQEVPMSPIDRQPTSATSDAPDQSFGARLAATDGRALTLRGVSIRAEARGGLARTELRQRFVNSYSEPLRVTYLVPLPQDAALAGDAFRIVAEGARIAAARERFEAALVEGRAAGLVEQERANLFTLEIGNVPPEAEVVAELTIDKPLGWLSEGMWEWRFPTVVGPRYLGGGGRVSDAERVTVDVSAGKLDIETDVTLVIRNALAE